MTPLTLIRCTYQAAQVSVADQFQVHHVATSALLAPRRHLPLQVGNEALADVEAVQAALRADQRAEWAHEETSTDASVDDSHACRSVEYKKANFSQCTFGNVSRHLLCNFLAKIIDGSAFRFEPVR